MEILFGQIVIEKLIVLFELIVDGSHFLLHQGQEHREKLQLPFKPLELSLQVCLKPRLKLVDLLLFHYFLRETRRFYRDPFVYAFQEKTQHVVVDEFLLVRVNLLDHHFMPKHLLEDVRKIFLKVFQVQRAFNLLFLHN